jgi:DNA-directed RNA polymerase specialized sigma24 family protein
LRAKLLRHARLAVRDQSLAEDLAQDTLVAVLQHHAQRRGDSTLSTWAISILKHKIADWYRSPASTRMVPAGDEDSKLDETIDALYDADGRYVERVPAWQQPEHAPATPQKGTTMKSIVIALSLAVASTAAFAQEATPFQDNTVSAKSRAEVRAELDAARARGELAYTGEASEYRVDVAGNASRAQVRAEAIAALKAGRILFGEAPERNVN